MNTLHQPTKLTLTILRIKGKKVHGSSWTTLRHIHILGKSNSFPSGELVSGAYVDDEHAQISFKDGCWYIQNLSSQFSLAVDGQSLSHQAVHLLAHNSLIELGLCQILVSDHRHIEAAQTLQNMLMLNTEDLYSPDLSRYDDLMLSDSHKGQILAIGAQNAIEKTTFEDMGLGVHFDEQQFFQQIQSESTHIRNLQATENKESLDILDQLAIESEIAIINPSLLTKEVDYWQNTSTDKFVSNSKISELEHLFALKTHHDDHMVPLDNLERINDLLANKDNIDKMIGRLDDVDDYALFESELRVEPLRLFSLENQNIRDYAVQSTPEFTRKEHHASSMDGYFSEPNSQNRTKHREVDIDKKESDDDWFNKFSESLDDKVSANDILDSFAKESKHK